MLNINTINVIGKRFFFGPFILCHYVKRYVQSEREPSFLISFPTIEYIIFLISFNSTSGIRTAICEILLLGCFFKSSRISALSA